MRRQLAAAAALIAFAAPITACGSDSKPDVAACKAALAKQLDTAVKAGDKAEEGSRPDECEGVNTATLQRLLGEVTEERVGKAVEDGLSSAFPSVSADALDITADCRAWIEGELQDDSSSLDATAGQDACGYMSEGELQQAIDQVTDDLMNQG